MKTADGTVYSIRSLLNTLAGYYKLMALKDAQIELLQNKVASLQGIIHLLEQDVEDV